MLHVFIETTIHIDRLTAPPSVQALINSTIQDHTAITSSYVWMEFQRTIGQDYQYLIDLFRRQHPTTISQLLDQLGEGRNLFSQRRVKRLLHTIAKLFEKTKTTEFEPLECAYLLEKRRDWLLNHHFFDGIDQMLDTTACDLVRPEYKISPGGCMSCRRETARCALPALLKNNAPLLQQLSTNPAVLAALESKTRRTLTEVSIDTELAKGEQNCWSLGDLIIVLECPPDAVLWTTNVRHFATLCQAFGRQLFQPDAP